MTNRAAMEFWVGIFVIAGIVALTMLAMKVGNLSSVDVGESYKVTAKFDNIGQLKVKAPITMAGVRVGRVSRIHMDQNFFAVVTMDIEKRFSNIPSDTGASILTAGLLGEQYIALEPGGDPTPLQEGDEFTITQSAMILEKLIGQFLYNQADSGNEKK
ncbi:MAG: outer membrane lipid asymmetry maintenance protein MlaD [Gammaproteobacteria bacterium]|nr:outer membrane lipid asymmetry maintenance protein MlaD [Gammaproteobacteria bacterium]